jgi:hypothetical protein
MQPLRNFICDTCHEIIVGPEFGMIEWLETATGPSKYRIVHVPTVASPRVCRKHAESYGIDVATMPLAQVAGPEGVNFFRARLSDLHAYEACDRARLDELEVMLCRLAMPNYENVRRHMDGALQDGFFDNMDQFQRYKQSTLRDVIRMYGERETVPPPAAAKSDDETE